MTAPDHAALCERLRERAASYRLSGPSAEHTAVILDEAAAAIERLAAAVALLDDAIWLNPNTGNFEVNHDGSVEKARAILSSAKGAADDR